MSACKTIQLSRTGDGSVTFDRTVTKWDCASYPANVQVSVSGLGAGSFDVLLLPAGETTFKEHITGSSVNDLVMIAGKEAPLFHSIRVTASGTSGATITATVTFWERGI